MMETLKGQHRQKTQLSMQGGYNVQASNPKIEKGHRHA